MSKEENSSKPKEEQTKNKEPKEENKTPEPVLLSRSYRFIAFLIMVTTEMAMNVSSGVLSAASKAIKRQYSMKDVEFGYFGLAQGIGRSLGSIVYTILVNQVSAKWYGGAFSIFKGLVLLCFSLTQSKWILIILRGVIGFFHMQPSTYIPLWIDQYGFRKYKTVQLSFLQALVPMGKVLGFLFVNIFTEERWKIGYNIEAVYLMFCGAFVVLSPSNYFNRKVALMTDEERPTEYRQEKWKEVSVFNKRVSKEGSKSQKLWNDLSTVIFNYEFEICNIAKALQTGGQSCVHFWCGDFMINRLGMDGATKTFIYTLMNISGPIFGFLVSPLINKYFGSYETPHAPFVMVVLHIITMTFGFLATLINNTIAFVIFMTLFFGFISLCLAMVFGSLMIVINQDLKGICFSVGNITSMSTTGALFPVIYGKINDIFNPKGIKYAGMLSIMILNASSSLFLLELGRLKMKRKKKQDEKKKDLIDNKDNEEGKEMEDK